MMKSVHWDITTKCNLRCRHCYNAEKYFNCSSDRYIDQEMSSAEALRCVDMFFQDGIEHIHLLGGEPLASQYLFPVIERAKKYGMIVTINSNACLLTPTVQAKLLENDVDQFAASLDGCTPETNDAIRGKGVFHTVVRNMTSFVQRIREGKNQTKTAIVFTVTKKNLGELVRLPELAARIGVDLVVLTTFIESGAGKENKQDFHADYSAVCSSIEDMVNQIGTSEIHLPIQIDMRPKLVSYFMNKYNAQIVTNPKNDYCYAGTDMWYLEANGCIHPCLAFQLDSGKGFFSSGEIVKEDLSLASLTMEEVRESNYIRSFLQERNGFSVKDKPLCRSCTFLNDCKPCFMDFKFGDCVPQECTWVEQQKRQLYDSFLNSKFFVNESVWYCQKQKKVFCNNQETIRIDNDVAEDMLCFLLKDTDFTHLRDYLCQEYNVDEDILLDDMTDIVLILLKNHIICMEE